MFHVKVCTVLFTVDTPERLKVKIVLSENMFEMGCFVIILELEIGAVNFEHMPLGMERIIKGLYSPDTSNEFFEP